MTMDPVRDIRAGIEVFTQDGDKIGTVKEVHEAFLKVDAPLQPDYWLSRETVLSFTAERVTLNVDRADLDSYKVEPPDDEG